jgi:hypothetical protein
MFVRGDIMPKFRTILLAMLPILAMTAETAPAGLRAAFERFDRQQSRAAARICDFYLNSASR